MKDLMSGDVSDTYCLVGRAKVESLCSHRIDFKSVLYNLEKLMEAKKTMDLQEVIQANTLIKEQLSLLNRLFEKLGRHVVRRSQDLSQF